jgi:hypothetical protein
MAGDGHALGIHVLFWGEGRGVESRNPPPLTRSRTPYRRTPLCYVLSRFAWP